MIDNAILPTAADALSDVESGRDSETEPAQTDKRSCLGTTLLRRLQARTFGSSRHADERSDTASAPGEQIRLIREQPVGYPKLAAFMDSDPAFMVYRRFGYTRQRLLLYWQDVVREKEEALDKLDREDAADSIEKASLWHREGDDSRRPPRRRNLILDLGGALREYDDILWRTVKSYDFETPSIYDRTDVGNAIRMYGGLAPDDRTFLKHTDDLISLAGDKERTKVHEFFERHFFSASKSFSKYVSRTRVQRIKMEGSGGNLELYSTQSLNRIVASFFVMAVVALLMIPAFTLYWMESSKVSGFSMNAAILGFTSAFALMCSTCTSAKRHEIFGATAAYCAVLVVFISQGPSNGQS